MSRFLDARRFHAEKLCWQHQVLADAELNAFAKTLGAFLMHYLDDVEGGGWTSQPFLAERLHVDVRTIRRAFVELENRDIWPWRPLAVAVGPTSTVRC